MRITLAFTLRPSPYLQITLPDYCISWAYLHTWIKEGNHTNVDYCYQIYFCFIPKTIFFFSHVASAFFPLYTRPVLLDHCGFWTNCISITWGALRKEDPQPSHRCSKICAGNRNLCFKRFDNHSFAYSVALPFHGNILFNFLPLTSRKYLSLSQALKVLLFEYVALGNRWKFAWFSLFQF